MTLPRRFAKDGVEFIGVSLAKPEERQHTGLHDAVESLLGSKDVAVTATKAFGCTIKFKPAA